MITTTHTTNQEAFDHLAELEQDGWNTVYLVGLTVYAFYA